MGGGWVYLLLHSSDKTNPPRAFPPPSLTLASCTLSAPPPRLRYINDLLDTAKSTKGRGKGDCWPAPVTDLVQTGGRRAPLPLSRKATRAAGENRAWCGKLREEKRDLIQ